MIYIDYIDETNDAVISTSEPDELFEKMKGYFSEGSIYPNKIEVKWNIYLQKIHFVEYLVNSGLTIKYSDLAKKLISSSNNNRKLFLHPRDEIQVTTLRRKLKEKDFQRKLFNFQERNVLKLISRNAGASFSVPGAGKTTEALAYFTYLCSEKDKLLVICPKNAFNPWKEEVTSETGCFKKYENNFHILDAQTNKKKGNLEKIFKSDSKYFVTNYDQVVNNQNSIIKFLKENNVFLIIDESHNIKGRDSQRTRIMLEICFLAKYKLILSGTPVPNRIDELVPQFNFLYPEVPSNGIDILEKINGIYVRTNRSELDIPNEKILSVPVPMSRNQKVLYKLVRNHAVRDIAANRNRNIEIIRKSIILIIQLLSNPLLGIERYASIPGIKNNTRILENLRSPKIDYAVSLARDLAAEDKKVIIWSLFVKNVKIIKARLEDLGAVAIHGSVKIEERELAVDAFNNDPSCKVIVINPAAGSEAISLHKNCNNAIYIDTGYNSVYWLQSIDRIRRIGQQHEPIIHVLKHAQTLDDQIEHRLRDKVELMQQVLNDDSILAEKFSIDLDETNNYDDDYFDLGIEQEINGIIDALKSEMENDYSLL